MPKGCDMQQDGQKGGSTLIEVKNLTKKYGDHTAVDHLSFQVTEGGGLTENVGISAEFPARWNNTIKETGICTNFQGDRLGYLSVTAVKPADPEDSLS